MSHERSGWDFGSGWGIFFVDAEVPTMTTLGNVTPTYGRQLTLLIATGWMMVAPVQSRAGYILDQSNVVPSFLSDFAIFHGQSMAQTFTVGNTGQLCAVGVQVYKNTGTSGDLTLEIVTTTGGVPAPNSATPLFQTTVALAAIPTLDDPFGSVPMTLVNVSAGGIPVVRGDVLAIVLRSPNGLSYPPGALWRSGVNSYAPGAEFYQPGADTTWTPSTFGDGTSQDAGFQTYVTPEPSSLLLAGSGLLAVAGLRYARARKGSRRTPTVRA